MKLADVTLGIGAQALAFMHVLAGQEPHTATWDETYHHYRTHIETYPFYNCRERGISLVISHGNHSGPYLMATFFEHRNSDAFCCWLWRSEKRPFNGGPTVDEIPELVAPDKYHHSFSTDAYDFWPMVEFLHGEMASFYAEDPDEMEFSK